MHLSYLGADTDLLEGADELSMKLTTITARGWPGSASTENASYPAGWNRLSNSIK